MVNILNVRVGDTIPIPVYPHTEANLRRGTVVYVHPQGRFFTLEYETASGTPLRESFIPHGDHIACRDAKEEPSAGSPGRAA